jgi:hypothetical protein
MRPVVRSAELFAREVGPSSETSSTGAVVRSA